VYVKVLCWNGLGCVLRLSICSDLMVVLIFELGMLRMISFWCGVSWICCELWCLMVLVSCVRIVLDRCFIIGVMLMYLWLLCCMCMFMWLLRFVDGGVVGLLIKGWLRYFLIILWNCGIF